MSDEIVNKPSSVFWREWQESGREFPPLSPYCPRCGRYMDGGFWMHLCSDNRPNACVDMETKRQSKDKEQQ